jgi:hypothetical protein
VQTLEFLQRLEWEGEQQWKGYMDKYIEACAQAHQDARRHLVNTAVSAFIDEAMLRFVGATWHVLYR